MIDEQQYNYKSNLLEKHIFMQIIKKELEEQLLQKQKHHFFQKAWIKLITIVVLCSHIKLKKEVNFK